MNAIEYRPEIDGLRAVAIVPVILFNLGAGWLPGGYLGVDVFFVISGFLITSILLREMTAGQFSFKRFWARRVRRIMPALLLVTVATLVATWILVFPPDRPAIGRQAAATLLSVANFYFWRFAGDYWGSQAEDSPFLHAWSLAVEEQFYVFFPVILSLIVRWFPRRIVVGLLAILVGSLCLFIYGVQARPSATFYLLPTRAWELATGAVLAAMMHGPKGSVVARPEAAILAGVGLAATVASYFVVPVLSVWAVVQPGDADGLLAYLQAHARRVVLVEQPPELAGVGRNHVAEIAAFRGIRPIANTRQSWPQGNAEQFDAGRRVIRTLTARFPKCEVLPTVDLLLENGRVWFLDGNKLLYKDDNHLTTDGTSLAASRIRDLLSR